jgi:hypothetical protein
MESVTFKQGDTTGVVEVSRGLRLKVHVRGSRGDSPFDYVFQVGSPANYGFYETHSGVIMEILQKAVVILGKDDLRHIVSLADFGLKNYGVDAP